MSIDRRLHSLFGASKVAADVLVQEYGRYFGMKTACFPRRLPDRPQSLRHQAARVPGLPDEMRGHRQALHGLRLQGKTGPRQHPQRRPDHALSTNSSRARAPARSTTSAAAATATAPCSRPSRICEEITGSKFNWKYTEDNRSGDHIWWISDISRFQSDYPGWKQIHDMRSILKEIYEMNRSREALGALVPSVCIARSIRSES